jgi:ParB-like chromosome segregation protein Spo0J
MIRPDARLALRWLPLAALRVTEYQPRYPDRVLHYARLLSAPENAGQAAGVLSVAPCADGAYMLLDGHHRYCAYIIAGRSEALCLVIDERVD